jgi:5-methylcytosine-specific restriction endonuclease McrA
MRDCRVCGKRNVRHKTGPATCPKCSREKYLTVKRRYQQSAKGKATARAREERPDVKEKRRTFSASPQGQRNQKKYQATEKGKATQHRSARRYQTSEKGKAAAAAYHQRMKNDPAYRERRRRADARYKRGANGKALKWRQYAMRKDAILSTSDPLTAEDWAEILLKHNHRCRYCGSETKLTVDHVIPLSKGGEHSRANVVPACQSCNSEKHDRLVEDWLIVPAATRTPLMAD